MPEDTYQSMSKTLRALLLLNMRDIKQREQVDVLDLAGFGQTEIAEIVGSTSKAISVRLAEIRRARKNRKK